MDQSFPKKQHLKHRKLFDALFSSGRKEFQHPVLAVWKVTELQESVPVQTGFTASKRNYKKAVKRNELKRIMRESYRTQKQPLEEYLAEQNKQIALLFVMLKTDNTSYEVVQAKILLLLQEIERKLRNAE